jgi:hypothetical protein
VNRSFRRHGDGVRMQLEDFEIELLEALQAALRTSLETGDPADPIVRRLFPATVSGDEQADADLRGMIHEDLLRERLAGLDALLDLLARGTRKGRVARVDLVEDEPLLVLGVLNDLRLAIGAQVDIQHLDREHVDPKGPVAYRLAVMDHLAWLQEQLLRVIDPPSSTVYEEEEP